MKSRHYHAALSAIRMMLPDATLRQQAHELRELMRNRKLAGWVGVLDEAVCENLMMVN